MELVPGTRRLALMNCLLHGIEGEGEGGGEERQPTWSRRLDLPFRINPEKANAKFTNGILRIELPKAEAAGVRKIAIQ